jgi:hypothetical protein
VRAWEIARALAPRTWTGVEPPEIDVKTGAWENVGLLIMAFGLLLTVFTFYSWLQQTAPERRPQLPGPEGMRHE